VVAKKTKKQKIIADLRRQVTLAKQTSADQKIEIVTSPAPLEKVYQTETLYAYPLQLVAKDLTKTLLLCILAISFEVVIYLSLEGKLILPF